MQGALIVEYHEIAVAQPELQMKARVAQQRGEAPVGGIERARIARGEPQRRDRAAVVMHGAHLAGTGQLDQRPLGVELGILGAVSKRHRRPSQDREGLRRSRSQVLRDGEPVAEQAFAAVGRCDQCMQHLKSGHRFAIGIVGVQP